MQRPTGVWIISILMFLAVLSQAMDLISSASVLTEVVFETAGMFSFVAIILLIRLCILVLACIMAYHFFSLRKQARTWVHAFFLASLTYAIILLASQISLEDALGLNTLIIISALLIISVLVAIWWALIRYIDRKKVDGKQVFT